MPKRNQGFTLIELIIVIVILGILAVTAAPKFIDISSDAKIASLKGTQAAIISANKLFNAKARIQGKEKLSWIENGAQTMVDIGNGVLIASDYGYPHCIGSDYSHTAAPLGYQNDAIRNLLIDSDNISVVEYYNRTIQIDGTGSDFHAVGLGLADFDECIIVYAVALDGSGPKVFLTSNIAAPSITESCES
jgi:prepilin-type N-terminal cleavage/methylation domain-containing protein